MVVSVWMYVVNIFICISPVLSCTFPSDWHGNWYQNVFGPLSISETTISRKGICQQRDRNKYLILNSQQKCYRCLVITKQHDNILQYKESYCHAGDSLEVVCRSINSDAPLHTIVRVPGIPVSCPFQGEYSFTYSNNSKRECDDPISEIHACADESKFKFVYKKCLGMPETQDKIVNFQCLATWENGEQYLYGRFSGSGLLDREQKYRCFMHRFYGRQGEMSMSADATCQGLQSPSVGTYTMNLGLTMRPRMQCTFPSSFEQSRSWRDLTGRYQMTVDGGMQIIRLRDMYPSYSLNPDDSGSHEIKMVMRCVNARDESANLNQYLVYTTDNQCDSSYRCLRIKQRDSKVVELYIGRKATINTACTEDQFVDGEKHILIQNNIASTKCPTMGNFGFTDKTSECRGQFMIGCRSGKDMEIVKTCPVNKKSVLMLECLTHWKEDKTHYVIVQKSPVSMKPATCLAFTEAENGIEVQEDEFCTRKTMVSRTAINYILFTPAGKCSSRPLPAYTESPSDITDRNNQINPDRGRGNRAGGSSGIIDADNGSSTLSLSSFISILLTSASLYICSR